MYAYPPQSGAGALVPPPPLSAHYASPLSVASSASGVVSGYHHMPSHHPHTASGGAHLHHHPHHQLASPVPLPGMGSTGDHQLHIPASHHMTHLGPGSGGYEPELTELTAPGQPKRRRYIQTGVCARDPIYLRASQRTSIPNLGAPISLIIERRFLLTNNST